MRVLGYLMVAAGLVFLEFAIFVLAESGFHRGFFGCLLGGLCGISGFSLILQSKDLMD